MQAKQSLSDQDTRNQRLNKRMEDIGWGLFLIMIGALWLMHGRSFRKGSG